MQRELGGGSDDQLLDHLRVERHLLVAHRGATRGVDLPGLGVEHLEADVAEHAQGGLVDGFDLVRRQQLGRWLSQSGLRERSLIGQRR